MKKTLQTLLNIIEPDETMLDVLCQPTCSQAEPRLAVILAMQTKLPHDKSVQRLILLVLPPQTKSMNKASNMDAFVSEGYGK